MECSYPFETTLKLHANYTLSAFRNTKYEISTTLLCTTHPQNAHYSNQHFTF